MTLAAHHYTMLHTDRAITDVVIQGRGYCTLDHPDDVRDLDFSKPQSRTVPVLAIPLWDVHGQRTGWQIRPDSPRITSAGRVLKYENAKGSRLRLDVHPTMQPQLGDPTVPLWITEGIPKADALTSQGACTIALRGVWGFKGTNEHGGKVILPDWQSVALNDRLVYVCFDSDIYRKPEVEAALKALYQFLRDRQARPGLVRWPEEYRQGKVGADDFLAMGKSLEDLLAMVPPLGLLPTIAPAQRNGHAMPPRYNPDLLLTDTYNAAAFVADHGDRLRYCYPWKAWLVWQGRHWQRDTSGEVLRLAKATVKQLARRVEGLHDEQQIAELLAHIRTSLSTAKLEALVRNAQSEAGIAVQPEALDTNPWLLACANGTLNLKDGTLREHRQADLITKCLPTAYDATATCPLWEQFLWRLMGGSQGEDDPDTMGVGELENRRQADTRARLLMTFLQKAVGYSLTGCTREQCFFLLHGPTKTGKSTFINIIKALLAAYGTQAEMSTFLHKEKETVRNDLADLAGMRLVCAIETDEGKRLAEALIKQLTGGTDMIKARFLFEEYFEYRPQFKVFLATNFKPKVNASDDGLWERIRLVPFVVQIPKEERDKDLETKLRAELPGILAWAVRGCLAWQADDGLGEPPAVLEATQEYREEMDTLIHFIDECCVTNVKDAKVKATLLASAYQAWCKGTGTMPLANLAFIAALEQRGYTRERGHANQYYWHGIGLGSPDDADEK